MNGVVAVRALLVAHAPLTGLVPIGQIVAGVVPQGSALPALSLMSVSSTDRNIIKAGAVRRVTERVQVTVLAATYPAAKAILKAVRQAAADRSPTIAGIAQVTVQTDSAGPVSPDEQAGIHMQAQDFRVSFNEAT